MLIDKYLLDSIIAEEPASALMKVLCCYNSEDKLEAMFFTDPTETTFFKNLSAGVEKDKSQIRNCTQCTVTINGDTRMFHLELLQLHD